MIDTGSYPIGNEGQYRACPLCNTKFPLSSFGGDKEDWYDERLAIPCCSCLRLLKKVEIIKTDFSSRFKKTAVIAVDYEYITTKVKGKTKWRFYRGHYTKQDLELFLIDMLKYKYSILMAPSNIKTIIEKLKIWGIIDG